LNALRPFLDQPNIAFWPTSGFRQLTSVNLAKETGCIELDSSSCAPSIVRPSKLTLRRIDEAPAESFLLMELATLTATDVHSREILDEDVECEEVCELADGSKAGRDVYDELLATDSDNTEFFAEPRLMTRWFRGQILIISPSSLLNQFHRRTPSVRLSRMTVAEVSNFIDLILRSVRHGKRFT